MSGTVLSCKQEEEMKMNNRKLSLTVAAAAVALSLTTGADLRSPVNVSAQSELYKSCEADKLTAPLVLDAAATPAATEAATITATESASTSTESDIVFLSIVGSESQACYLATEIFLENNMMGLPAGFNGAVGISQTISGDVALDRSNVANSQIGDITINISEFKSDNARRDGFIRQNFLQSNKYPFATLTNATVSGLPTAAYEEGTTLAFQIKGTLNVHDTDRDTTFNATGTFKEGTLVIQAITDLKMSDFNIQTPNIGGLLKVDDAIRLVINIVAREPQETATPAK
jgi:polyisoprenoid-binding protein YceI